MNRDLDCVYTGTGCQDIVLGPFKVGEAKKRADDVWLVYADINDQRFSTHSYLGLTDALNKLNFRYHNPALFQTGRDEINTYTGASPEKLKAFLDNKVATKTALNERRAALVAEIDQQISETEELIEHVTNEIIDVLWPGVDVDIGYHECEDSMFDVCAYNSIEDPAHDCCLLCDKPEERK